MPMTVSSAAAGRPVLPATHRIATTTATPARMNSNVVSTFTRHILPDVGRSRAHDREWPGSPDRSEGPGPRRSVPVVIRLVRALDVDAEVFRLLLGQRGEPDAEGVEV